ncbi:MAG: DUF4835 family protein [Chlorobi bacterium]|nr:DUF4835 family protein [Chlorobiota bacterium]
MKKLFVVLFLVVTYSSSFSQELQATVQVNFEQLQTVYKENLVPFQAQIEEYLNSTKFTEQNWEWDKIQCSFNIFFTSASSETSYKAQVVITSSRPIEGSDDRSLMLSIMDNKWAFIYEKNQSMYFNPTYFDPLSSFLDYYALLIIAMDSDSYEPFGGNYAFQKALQIAVQGSSSGYAASWSLNSDNYNKRGLVEDATSAQFQKIRQDFYDYHYNGLDVFSKDRHATYNNIIKIIYDIAALKKTLNRRSSYLTVFFDAKSGEITNYLMDYEDRSIFSVLQKIDPAHTTKYLEAQNR